VLNFFCRVESFELASCLHDIVLNKNTCLQEYNTQRIDREINQNKNKNK